ncbi:hypothetical protein ACFXAE_02270 [Streptomyces sp. NPDC059454]|uniref:hypothetical protein n=1 Tax=Streptomyces sp. NPDC059454 TaxID=3346836 RepID=UPI0036B989FF
MRGVIVVAVVTLAASAHRNARGRAGTPPPSAAAPAVGDGIVGPETRSALIGLA